MKKFLQWLGVTQNDELSVVTVKDILEAGWQARPSPDGFEIKVTTDVWYNLTFINTWQHSMILKFTGMTGPPEDIRSEKLFWGVIATKADLKYAMSNLPARKQ